MSGLPPVDERTFRKAYERVLAARPDEIAHIDRTSRYTYAQSFERSLRYAAGLTKLGVKRQEPVAFLLDNSIDFAHLFFASSLAAMIEIPINCAYKGRFLSHILNDSAAETLVVEDLYVERLAAVASDLTSLRTIVIRGNVDAGNLPALARFRVVPLGELETSSPMAPAEVSASDLIGYLYTSGTTGVSKGVMYRHAHAYTHSSRENEEPRPPTDRCLIVLPLFHGAGQMYCLYGTLIQQARVVIEPSFSVSRFWPTVREHGITWTVLLGALAELLQQVPPQPDDADNPLEVVTMAPLASDVKGFAKRFGLKPQAVYGMSELGNVLYGPPESIVGGECGFPRPGFHLRLVDPDGNDAAVGQVGELWARHDDPRVTTAGYRNLPEKTAELIKDGWVHTGDAFKKDAEGRWYFADRIKDALRRRGENISSFEVERAINEFPAVLESAVVAAPSTIGEDEIKAVIVKREGHDIDWMELSKFLVDRLPYFMVPRYFEFASELPKTPTHKVQKRVLRDRPIDAEGVWDREAAGLILRRGA